MEGLKKKYFTKLKFIRIMKKILSIGLMVVYALTLIVICLPCLLIFSTGQDGEMTWMNWLGIGWLAVLIVVFKRVNK